MSKLSKVKNIDDLSQSSIKYKSSELQFEELLLFYQQYNRSPSYKSHDIQEKKLYSWVQSMKMAKRGKGTAHYPDWLDEKAEKYGISKWFQVLDKSKEQFILLIDFYQEHNRKPRRYNAINSNEKKLAHWVYHMRQKRSKGDLSYPNWLDEEAKKYDILEWFLKQDIRQDIKERNENDERTQEVRGNSS